MPAPPVTVANLPLSPRQKSQIAEAITAVHHSQTGAPRFFAQVLFSSANEGEHFVCGRVNTAPQVSMHGLVRDGLGTEVKEALMSQLLKEIMRLAGHNSRGRLDQSAGNAGQPDDRIWAVSTSAGWRGRVGTENDARQAVQATQIIDLPRFSERLDEQLNS